MTNSNAHIKLLKAAHRANIPLEMTLPDGTFIKLPLTNAQCDALFEPQSELKDELEQLRTRARSGFTARKSA